MPVKIITQCLLIAALAVSLSSCLTRRTVTRDGRVVESNYVFKRPLKSAVDNSR